MMRKSEKLEICKIMWTALYFLQITLIFCKYSRTEDTTILRKSKKLKKSFQTFRQNLENKSFGEIADILIYCFTKC